MAKVSVIVPYLKGPAYLSECVESISKQSCVGVEILVVDDKDGHEVPEDVKNNPKVTVITMADEINADEYFEKKQKVKDKKRQKNFKMNDDEYEALKERDQQRRELKQEKKEQRKKMRLHLSEDEDLPFSGELEKTLRPFGVGACRNMGIKHATGEYIYFIDGDDYLYEDSLDKLIKTADEKKAKVVTGNKTDTWFRPISFDFEKSKPDSTVEGVVPFEGEDLENIFQKRFSVQHMLIRKDYLDSLNIEFDEYNTFYSDMDFIINVIVNAGSDKWINGDSIYIWRHRNDPIHLPALCQKKRKRRAFEYIDGYEKSIKLIPEGEESLLFALNRRLCEMTLKFFPSNLKGVKSQRYTKRLKKIPKNQVKRILKEYPFFTRRELSFLIKGKYRLAKPMKKIGFVLKKKRGLFGKPIQYWKFLDKKFFRKMPVKENWIFIESFFGKSYSDSPKYLYEYLYDTYGDKYRYIWCLNERAPEMKGHPSICKRHTLRYVYYTARCKYFICNTRQPAWYKKRSEVIYLETWHGTPLKKLAFDLDDIHAVSQDHKKLFYKQSKDWDYLISANPFSTEVFERAFCYPKENIIEVGYPRNDILYAKNRDEIAKEVKKELGIPEDKRVILYAPTWRDNQFYEKAKYKFSLELDLNAMREKFGKDSILLLRTHYYIADILDLSEYEGFVYNASQYNDISRLYLISDMCITDYSSVFFDYANLRRPILFFAYDYEDYRGEIRGMYFDMEKDLPGPIVQTNEELFNAIENIDEVTKEYKDKYDEFYDRFCSVDDGNASKRAIEIMLKLVKEPTNGGN